MCDVQSPLGQLVATLVPWQIRLIQVVRTPKAKRWDIDTLDTHRLSVMEDASGNVTIQPERMLDSPGMRQRFSRAVRVAIFVYGVSALTREQENAPAVEPKVAHHGKEIWCENGPVSAELRSTMAPELGPSRDERARQDVDGRQRQG